MAFVIAAAALWGTIGPVARIALAGGMTPLEVSFWRALLGGLCFVAYAAARGMRPLSRRDLAPVGAFALVGVTLFYLAYFQAVATGGAALAVMLLYTAPAWVAVFALLWLRERVAPLTVGAIVLTMAGVAVMAIVGGGSIEISAAAITWGLLSGIAYATYYLFGKRYFPRHDPALLFAYILPLGALPLLPAVSGVAHPLSAWGALLYLAVVPTFAAYRLYAHGLQQTAATRAATLATIEPVVAAVLAWLVWSESLGAGGYAGAALVLAGVLVSAARS